MLLWLLIWLHLRGNKLWLKKILLEIILSVVGKKVWLSTNRAHVCRTCFTETLFLPKTIKLYGDCSL